LSNELWMLGPAFELSRPVVARNGVVNAFSLVGGPVAPGQIVSIFGSGLGPINEVTFGIDSITGRLPVSGPGLTVTWNGVPAPLYFARADQLNVQVPYEIAGAREAALVITVNGQSSDPVPVPVAPTRPGLFPRIWNEDGTLNSLENPARPGSVIVLFATGHGVTTPGSITGAMAVSPFAEPAAPLELRIGGREAEILFRGLAPGTAGVMQVNARVPASASSSVPAVLSIGGVPSQDGVEVSVRD
jgi:uncharacterized protein (TIGR03437 family)